MGQKLGQVPLSSGRMPLASCVLLVGMKQQRVDELS